MVLSFLLNGRYFCEFYTSLTVMLKYRSTFTCKASINTHNMPLEIRRGQIKEELDH